VLVKHLEWTGYGNLFEIVKERPEDPDELLPVMAWITEQYWTVLNLDRVFEKPGAKYTMQRDRDVTLLTAGVYNMKLFVVIGDPAEAILFKLRWCDGGMLA
jgi:hypothetical protein